MTCQEIGDWHEAIAPFPDVPAETPGILMDREEAVGVDDVIQDEPELNDQQQAILVADNADMSVFPDIEAKNLRNDVIDLTDEEFDEIVVEGTGIMVMPKLESKDDDEMQDVMHEDTGTRRSRRFQTANRTYNDYKLHVTVDNGEKLAETIESEEEMMRLSATAHYIMVHFAEKEQVTRKRKRKYKPNAGQYSLGA
jgi:hypothetical protein